MKSNGCLHCPISSLMPMSDINPTQIMSYKQLQADRGRGIREHCGNNSFSSKIERKCCCQEAAKLLCNYMPFSCNQVYGQVRFTVFNSVCLFNLQIGFLRWTHPKYWIHLRKQWWQFSLHFFFRNETHFETQIFAFSNFGLFSSLLLLHHQRTVSGLSCKYEILLKILLYPKPLK